jgi:hypothetical protein
MSAQTDRFDALRRFPGEFANWVRPRHDSPVSKTTVILINDRS